jgi:integrase
VIKASSRVARHGPRDAALIQVTYRHGVRVSEVVAVRWDQVGLKQGLLNVNRLKNGVPSTHPLRRLKLRALGNCSVITRVRTCSQPNAADHDKGDCEEARRKGRRARQSTVSDSLRHF